MQIKVKNREALLSHGDAEGPKDRSGHHGKKPAAAARRLRAHQAHHPHGGAMCAVHRRSRRWDLSKKRNVYLLRCRQSLQPYGRWRSAGSSATISRAALRSSRSASRRTSFHKTEVRRRPALPNAEGLRACKGDHPPDRQRRGRRRLFYRRHRKRRSSRAHRRFARSRASRCRMRSTRPTSCSNPVPVFMRSTRSDAISPP